MKVDEVVKSLRDISNDFENGNDGTSFDICGECMNAADLLERLQAKLEAITKDRDQWKRAAEVSRDVIQPKLRAEIEKLKASQPVRCGECVNLVERHYEEVGEKPYIKYGCKYRGNYQVHLNNYCSYGERRVEE